MLSAVNRAVCEAVGLPPGNVWVRYEPGSPEHYWEGISGTAEGQNVLVFVNLVQGRSEDQVHALFGAISSAVAQSFGIEPEYVWIRIEEFPLNRVGQGARSYEEIRKQK